MKSERRSCLVLSAESFIHPFLGLQLLQYTAFDCSASRVSKHLACNHNQSISQTISMFAKTNACLLSIEEQSNAATAAATQFKKDVTNYPTTKASFSTHVWWREGRNGGTTQTTKPNRSPGRALPIPKKIDRRYTRTHTLT